MYSTVSAQQNSFITTRKNTENELPLSVFFSETGANYFCTFPGGLDSVLGLVLNLHSKIKTFSQVDIYREEKKKPGRNTSNYWGIEEGDHILLPFYVFVSEVLLSYFYNQEKIF